MVLQKLDGIAYTTQLDHNMGYYTIRLELEASRISTIILPWGKYSYERLPMGIVGSSDIFQDKISELIRQLKCVRTYLDNLIVFS